MTLSEKQKTFPILLAKLILYIQSMGYQMEIGEVWRSPEEAARDAATGKGIKNSLHTLHLAADILIYKNGEYLTDSAQYKFAGDFWKAMTCGDMICAWGGDFKDKNGKPRPDGNHFSIPHGGFKAFNDA